MNLAVPKTLRIAYAGTPEFAVPALRALLASNHSIVAVFTQPDRPSGRGKKYQPSAVKRCALAAGLPVYQPERMGQDEADFLKSARVDAFVVAAYGQIVPQVVLDAPRFACVNIHASLLPRWRGAAPVVHALLAGDAETGVSIMRMEAGLDTGPVLMAVPCPITADVTQPLLTTQLSEMGARAIVTTLNDLSSYLHDARKQSAVGVTYAHKVTKSEAEIDWAMPADAISRHVRAYHSMPTAFAFYQDLRVRVLSAHNAGFVSPCPQKPGTVLGASAQGLLVACADGAVCISEMQLPGSKPFRVSDGLERVAFFTETGSVFKSRV